MRRLEQNTGCSENSFRGRKHVIMQGAFHVFAGRSCSNCGFNVKALNNNLLVGEIINESDGRCVAIKYLGV